MRRRRNRKRKRSFLTDVSLTPLIDTALTLLIIFMITSPMMNNSIKVNLPKGKVKEDEGIKQELVVYVDKDEHLFFNGIPMINEKDLVAALKESIGTGEKQTVYVKADQAVRYGNVIELVDEIKTVGGIDFVALATQKTT